MLEHAIRYAGELKWPILPVGKDKRPLTGHGSKDATIDPETIKKWFNTPGQYVGIGLATGKSSGIAVLDIDLNKPGCADSLQVLKEKFGFKPSNVCSITGSGGEHHFFKIPAGVRIRNAVALHGLVGIDVRGDGGYVVLPPSENESGPYRWMEDCSPFDSELPIAPDFMTPKSKKIEIETKIQAGQNGGRNTFLTREAGRLRAAGMEYDELLTALRHKNNTECSPPLMDDEVQKIARSICNYPPTINRNGHEGEDASQDIHSQILSFPMTDMGRAELLRFLYGEQIKYNSRYGTFYLWDSPRWQPDRTGHITNLVADASRVLQRAAATITDDTIRKDAMNKARKLESADGIAAVLRLFKNLERVATLPEDWDIDPHVLGTASGLVDLRTGELLPPNPAQLVSMNTDIPYNRDAKCPRWERFLLEVTDGDAELVNYLHKALGYSATGLTTEQCFFLLVGKGANGKSVFLNTLLGVFGAYGMVTPFSTFERTAMPSTQSNDLAALAGRRYVVSSETSISSVFNEARLKAVTGDERISARFLHQEFFTFQPQLKLWLSVNHPPKVQDDSYGFWRRVRKINFPVQFTEENADPLLAKQLESEREGILAWIIAGAVKWYKEGLRSPASVVQASTNYRLSTNPLYDFVNMCCIKSEEKAEPISLHMLFSAYSRWADGLNLRKSDRVNLNAFKVYADQQFAKVPDNDEMYVGVSIKPELLKSRPGNIIIRSS